MNSRALVDLLFVFLTVGLVLRTVYVRRNTAKRNAILARYKPGTPQHDFWAKRYSDKSLFALYALAATSVVQLALDYYKYGSRSPSQLALLLGDLVILAGLFCGFYLFKNAVSLKKTKHPRPKGWSNLS